MSGRDDPFGPGGKTVVRPNPGGGGGGIRRPEPQQWPNPGGGMPGGGMPNPGGGMPGGMPNPGGPMHNPRVNAPYPTPGGGFGPGVGGMPVQQDSWLSGPSPTQGLFPDRNQPVQQAPQIQKIPLEVALNARDGGQISAANPITAAAAPVLILLGRLRLMIVDMQAVPLMQHFATEIQRFERQVVEAGVDPHEAQIAKYALCATADDIVQNLPGTDRHVWLQYSMVAQFFGVRTSGVGFYEELGKILHNPGARYNLLELMHACLSLGFEGQYRGSPNGMNDLQRIRRDVYQTLRHLQTRADEDISPRWRGLDLRMTNTTTRVPLWAIGSAAAALLLVAYFVFRFLLGGNVDTVSDQLVALHPSTPIGLERASFAPAVVPDTRDQSQLERVREALGTEAGDSCVAADSVGQEIIIKVCNVLLFNSGSATVREEFAELATKIAASLENEPGQIRVIGHTDNVKPSGLGKYKSNFDLSVARAEAVEQVMAGKISDPGRLVVEGRGDLDPIADNATEEGRAQNRRVEIMIPREETIRQL